MFSAHTEMAGGFGFGAAAPQGDHTRPKPMVIRRVVHFMGSMYPFFVRAHVLCSA
jgi:hypothetical protein